jgi:hypothetical protein
MGILRKTLIAVGLLTAVLAVWIGVDLYRPYKTDIRAFDADEVARLDTAMWRSYYGRQRVRLFKELGELLENQFHFPFWRRQAVAYNAAKAAFIFKDGKTRGDYEKALPDLRKFFAEIHDVSTTDFNVDDAALTELEWWIVHRQRREHAPGDLSRALAEAASVVYGVPAEKLAEYGDLRAAAMEIRDNGAAGAGVTEDDWQRIDDLLHRSWASLHAAINTR